ncbi:MAG: hypothetical protein ACI8QC_003097 [Planctomycetota bacterium]|jgi:hypothetical protein
MRIPCALLLLAAPAVAQDFALDLVAGEGQTSLMAEGQLLLPATVIGDFDVASNPGGTRTLPGIFGGSGNQPVGMDLSLSTPLRVSGEPSGALTLGLDVVAGTLDVDGLSLDLTSGQAGTADLVLGLMFSTFRTFAPDSLYIGGFPLDIPLNGGSLSAPIFVQSVPATGTLTPTNVVGQYLVEVLVLGELSLEVDFAGTLLPLGPLPMVLPLVGTLQVNGTQASLSVGLSESFDQVIPDPLGDFEFADVPLPLPTILPPGETANLLLTTIISELSLAGNIDVSFLAEGGVICGSEAYCQAQPNSAGAGAELVLAGSTSLLADDLVLDASGLPVHEFGLLIFSTQRADLPTFGGMAGTLCVAPPFVISRNQVLNTGAAGQVSVALDYGNLPSGAVFEAGEVWHFQFWYRDALAGPTSNTSGGLSLTFCP